MRDVVKPAPERDVGATLGILGGTQAIPAELREHIGDRIVTCSLSGMYSFLIPKSCSELTARVCALVPSVMQANHVAFAFTDGETEYPEWERQANSSLNAQDILSRSPYSYDVNHHRSVGVRVELDQTPRVSAGDERKVTLTFFCKPNIYESRKLQIRLLLPDGWTVGRYDRTLSLLYPQPPHGLFGTAATSFTLTVGEHVDVINRVYAEITCPTLAQPLLVPITLIG